MDQRKRIGSEPNGNFGVSCHVCPPRTSYWHPPNGWRGDSSSAGGGSKVRQWGLRALRGNSGRMCGLLRIHAPKKRPCAQRRVPLDSKSKNFFSSYSTRYPIFWIFLTIDR